MTASQPGNGRSRPKVKTARADNIPDSPRPGSAPNLPEAVKVIVMVVGVKRGDDGRLTEVQSNEVVVPVAEWPTFAAAVIDQLEGRIPPPIPAAPPNRATRRAAQAKTNGKLDDVDA